MDHILGSLFTTVGYIAALGVYAWRLRVSGQWNHLTAKLALAGFIGGGLIAKVVELMVERAPFAAMIDPTTGGRTVLAGVIGGWVVVESGKAILKLKFSTGDAWALALPIGESIGRIGCWFNGCCYGRETTGFLAVYQHGAMRFPTQFLMSGVALFLAVLVWNLKGKVPLFPVYLAGWSLSRFLIEFLRQPVTGAGSQYLAQGACIVTFGVALGFLIRYKFVPPLQRSQA